MRNRWVFAAMTTLATLQANVVFGAAIGEIILAKRSDGTALVASTIAGTVVDATLTIDDPALYVSALTADGRFDTRFAATGQAVVYAPNGTWLWNQGLVVQPDGKVILVTSDGTPDLTLVRLTADGKLDASFGQGGFARYDWDGIDFSASVSTATPDGGLLVAGRKTFNDLTLTLVRVRADGSLDASFGQGGIAEIAAVNDTVYRDIEIDAQGGAVLLGDIVRLVRVLPTGELDMAFGTGGVVRLGSRAVNKLALSPVDGRIYFGSVRWNSLLPMTLSVYTADGRLDTSFGDNGQVSLAPYHWVGGMAFDAAGKLVIGGDISEFNDDTGNMQTVLGAARLAADGTIEQHYEAFGDLTAGGPILNNFWTGVDQILPLAEGRVLMASLYEDSSEKLSYLITAYNADGTFDRSFGQDGHRLIEQYKPGAMTTYQVPWLLFGAVEAPAPALRRAGWRR